MEFQVKLNEVELVDLVNLIVNQSVKDKTIMQSHVTENFFKKIIQEDSAKEFILSQSNSISVLNKRPDIFLNIINCSCANSWFNEQFMLMDNDNETFLMTWVSETIAIAHKSSFRKKHMDKYHVFLGIKEIFANAFVNFSEENPGVGKNILKKNIFINGESVPTMFHWINVFDSHPDFLLKNKFIDIFCYKDSQMPAFNILDWSKELISGISNFIDLEDVFYENKSILPKTILKRFYNFSQVGKISYLIPYMDEFFFDNPDRLVGIMNDFSRLSVAQLKINKIKDVEAITDYENFLNSVCKLKSLRENSEAKTKLKEVLLLLKEEGTELRIVATKFLLDLDLPKNNYSSEVKKNKV